MRSKLIIGSIIVFTLGILFWYFNIKGWLSFHKNTDTPKGFLNYSTIKKEDYTKDSTKLIQIFNSTLEKREGFFNNKMYFDSTKLIIDTIIYNQEFDKMAIFLIVANPTYRQLMPNKKYNWVYDATCYLGLKKNDTIALTWVGPVFTNSYNQQNISNNIRDACFRHFVTSDTNRLYMYNMNDVRFWSSPIWQKVQ